MADIFHCYDSITPPLSHAEKNVDRMRNPFFSIIIAVKNGHKTITRCIKSIIEQTCRDYEIIIMDGASTDGTVDVLKKFDPFLSCWESSSDSGLYHAWNKALTKARGKWILFLGADDYLWSSNVLEYAQSEIFHANPAYRIIYGRVASVTADEQTIEIQGGAWDRNRFLNTMYFSHQGVFHESTLFETYGKFNPAFRICGDYDFLLRVLKHEPAFYVDRQIIAGAQAGGLSDSIDHVLLVSLESRRARLSNGINNISLPWIYDGILRFGWVLTGTFLGNASAYKLRDMYRNKLKLLHEKFIQRQLS